MNVVHMKPQWPLSLRRWIIGYHKLAVQFVNTSCGIEPARAANIRRTGIATDAEIEALRRFFSCSRETITEALAAAKRHHHELSLLS